LAANQVRMRELLHRVQARGPPADDDPSIAAHLLRLRHPETGLPLTQEQLAGEFSIFFFAGMDTSAHTAAWAMFFIASVPGVRDRVEAELDALELLVTPHRRQPRDLVYADLARLKYLTAVVNESQRLAPVASGGTLRMTPVAMTLGGHHIPANTGIDIQMLGLHTNPLVWERAGEFDAERWMDGGAEFYSQPGEGGSGSDKKGGDGLMVDDDAPEHRPRRFMPFSAGPRGCVGRNLATMNYMTTLAVLLSRFRFELPEEIARDENALWKLQHSRITNQPIWREGEAEGGLPMFCHRR
jgi:cytochrome P450